MLDFIEQNRYAIVLRLNFILMPLNQREAYFIAQKNSS